MLRLALLSVLALAILLQPCPLSAQAGGSGGTGTNTVCGLTLHIEIGVPNGSAASTSWLCQNPPFNQAGKLRVHASEGSWVMILMQTYIRNDDPSDPLKVQLEASLLNEFPWLQPQPVWFLHDVIGPAYVGLPGITIDPQFFWWGTMLPLWGLDPDDVKKYYQPIVSGTAGTRIWQATCPVWDSNPIISNPHTTMSALWKNLTSDITLSSEDFYFFSLMQLAASIQGGPAALSFLDGDGKIEDAIDVGLHLSLQAIVVKSGDPGAVVTADEVTTDGLTGLDSLVLPGLEVTAPVEITISQGIPSSGNPFGPAVGFGLPAHPIQVGAWNGLSVKHLVPPTMITLHPYNAAPVTLPVHYHRPGVGKFFVPAAATQGPAWFDLSNAYDASLGGLTQPWSILNISTLPSGSL